MQRLFCTLFLIFSLNLSTFAFASEGVELKKVDWPFDGIFGKFDIQATQRGFQVYKEVCSACHSLKFVAYRNLSEIGFSEAEIKTLAAEYKIPDIDGDGQPVERNALPSDNFVPMYANEKAARAANNGAYPPDQSLIIKAREDGANYVYSLLNGYVTPPAGVTVPAGQYYNEYFPGHHIAMPPPLQPHMVTYEDGTEATVDQMAKDIVVFLQWAAEPEMEKRKAMGIKVTIYLTVFTVMFFLAKNRIWNRLSK